MNILNTTYNALLHVFIDTPFSMRNKRYHQDRIAMQIAARYGELTIATDSNSLWCILADGSS